jgi:hypothetical protein
MKRITALAFCVFALGGGVAFAANGNPSPTGTGQPSQSCQDLNATTPGPLVDPNSAFTLVGAAHYANVVGTTQISQYDVACYQTMTTHSH